MTEKITTYEDMLQWTLNKTAGLASCNREDISTTMTLQETGMDSLDVVEIVMHAEEELRIKISDEEEEQLFQNNLQQIVQFLLHKMRTTVEASPAPTNPSSEEPPRS